MVWKTQEVGTRDKFFWFFSESFDTYRMVVLYRRDSPPWVRLELLSKVLGLDFLSKFSNVQLW